MSSNYLIGYMGLQQQNKWISQNPLNFVLFSNHIIGLCQFCHS